MLAVTERQDAMACAPSVCNAEPAALIATTRITNPLLKRFARCPRASSAGKGH